jgi:outer membrane protein TolC
MPLAQLVQIALGNHPELGARTADVAAAEINYRQERVRPWLPLLSMGFSAGNFGGAGNQTVQTSWVSAGRIDCDVSAVWSLQNLAVGNHATQHRAQAVVGQAEAERARAVNRIRDEVAAAHALILARRQELTLARQRTATAQQAYEEDLRRARNLEGRPIEVLRSLDLLATARLDLVRVMAEYSQAQLQLYAALGNAMANGAASTVGCSQ